ncbi:MAG: hypothetical protein ACR2PT_23725 [Endozoicomonas sp.]
MNTEEKFYKIPIEEIAAVPEQTGTYQLLQSYYWLVDKDGCVFINKRSKNFMCNRDKRVADVFMEKKIVPEATHVQHIHQAWLKHELFDD